MVDITGSSGKSSLTAIMENDPSINCLVLQVDKYDRFKPYVIQELKDFKEKNKQWPSALIIDVPRDEETKNLHEIYGVLEKLNDGTLHSNFKGIKLKLTMKIGIPIIVFSNSAPIKGAMSPDRWDLMAIHKAIMRKETEGTVSDTTDYFIQQADVDSWLRAFTSSTVTWQNKITTTAPKNLKRQEDGTRYQSDIQLLHMHKTYTENIKKNSALATQNFIVNEVDGSKTKIHSSGQIESYGSERAATLSKAPEVVIKWYTHVKKNFSKEKL